MAWRTARGGWRHGQSIVYEGGRGTSYEGDISLDDIGLPNCVSTVPDTTAPVVSGCPADIDAILELGDIGGVIVNWTEPIATDETSNVEVISSHPPSQAFFIGKTGVAYIFRDRSGNVATCYFSVTVRGADTTSPTIYNCPDDIKTETEAGIGSNGSTVFWNEPNATDISGTPEIMQSHMSNATFPVGVTLVTYEFMDSSNNTANCSFSVMVETVDRTPPTVTRCPSDIDTVSGRHVTWREPDVFDLSQNVTIVKSHWPGIFVADQKQVAYTFTDPSGNTAACNFTINIVYDTTPPVINNCVDNITVFSEIGETDQSAFWAQPSGTDDFGRVMLIHATHTSGDRFPVGTTSVMYFFADDSYNVAYCNFSVVVQEVDTTPPAIQSCPSDMNLDIEPGRPTTPVSWIPPSATDVSGNVSLLSQSHLPGDSFTPGKTNVVYTFTDGSDNEAHCSFYVNLREVFLGNHGNSSFIYTDTTPPTIINCPSDIHESIELGTLQLVVSWLEPSAVDLKGSAVLQNATHRPGAMFAAESSTEVSYVFKDESGNVAFCIFSVIVSTVDTTPPEIISCPDDISETIQIGDKNKSISWSEPSASDVSGNVLLTSQTYLSGDFFKPGKTRIAYVFSDSDGNSVSCSFDVTLTIVDTTRPEIGNCPSNIVTDVEIGSIGTAVDWIEPSANDESGSVTLIAKTHSPGVRVGAGTTTVNYFFMDSSNNVATCTFQVIGNSVDSTPPEVEFCPNDIRDTIEVGEEDRSISWVEPRASDISGNVSLLSQSHSSGDNFKPGKTEIIYTFADEGGNSASCNFEINLNLVDTRKPNIQSCPFDIVTDLEVGSMGASVSWTEPSVTDESGNVTLLTQTHLPGKQFGVGTTTVTYLYVDPSNNIAACTFRIMTRSVDTTPPKIDVCPSDISVTIELGNTRKAVYWMEPLASDNSGHVTLTSQSHHSGDDFPLGMTGISYLFMDATENAVWCNFSVAVNTEDTIAPIVIDCPSDVVDKVEGSMSTSVQWKDPSATDASGNVTLLVKTHQPGEKFGIGTSNVMYIFADPSNNMAYCTFSVRVDLIDTLPPKILNCPSGINASAEVGIGQVAVFWIEPFGIDEAGRTSVLRRSHVPGQLFAANNVTQVSYIFGDEADNQASCIFSVTVNQEDTVAPEIASCPLDIYKTVEIGTSPVHVSWKEPIASDKSGHIEILTATHAPDEMFDVGSTLVSYIYADGSNNRATCEFEIHISESDTRAPSIISCPNNETVKIDIGSFGAIVNWDAPMAEDTSGYVMLLVQTHAPGTFFAIGTTMVSYIFRDNANNMAKCSFSVTVTAAESSSMIFNCPINIVAGIEPGRDTTTVTWIEPYAINLSAATKISSTHKPSESFPIGSTLVVYTFEDLDGYKQFCNFTVTVIENEYTLDVGDQEQFINSRVTYEGSGVSYAALVMSLSVVILIICILLLQLYIRKKKKADNVKLVGLHLSERDEDYF
ncbi:hyalin-like [Amphiura filiformis]|uniref:hyalin-like n=1 Tax=Amphiura filiformis TaxID=82378 RepID=UPI003B216DF4